MGKLRTLTAEQGKRTLAHRLTGMVDRVRQIVTEYGLRPYATYLVWTRWSGAERGEGIERVIRRTPLLPNPLVEDLTGVNLQPFAAGVLPVGSVRITRISQRYAQDLLMGLVMPCDDEEAFRRRLEGQVEPYDPIAEAVATESVPEPNEFFYELVEDGRSNDGRPPPRTRYRPFSAPFRDADQLGWTIVLERVSEDMARGGDPDDD